MHHHPGGSSPALFLLFTVLPCVVAFAYVRAARRDGEWALPRSLSFLSGIALILIAMSPPVMDWAHRDLRGHMAQHLAIGMFAPIGLAMGAPGTLLLRRVPVRVARRIVAFLGALPVRVLIHPVTAGVLDIGGMYVLYLTPLHSMAMADPVLHVLLHVHFVLAGYLFTWAIAGPDPAPCRPGLPLRLGVLFLATAAHSTLGKIMYAHAHPRNVTADLAELRSAAQWMYYGGDLAEILLACALFAAWFGQGRDVMGRKPARA